METTVVKRRRPRGSGSLFQPAMIVNGKKVKSKVWYIAYTDRPGHQVTECTEQDDKDYAKRLLARRIVEVADGRRGMRECGRTKVEELLEDGLASYAGKQALRDAQTRVSKRLGPFFGHMRAADVGNAQAQAYRAAVLAEGYSLGTVAVDLAFLKHCFHLGYRNNPRKVAEVPTIHVPTDRELNNARKGFLKPDEYARLMEKVPDYLRAPLALAYSTGLRREELFQLTWDKVDLAEGTIRLEAGDTKNRTPRQVNLSPSVLAILRMQRAVRDELDPHFSFVFFRRAGAGLVKVSDFTADWARSCAAAGLPNLLWHDLRRSAIRNMVRGGVPELVAMRVSGHKTRSVFERYNIVDGEDLADAARRSEAYVASEVRRAEEQAESARSAAQPVPPAPQDRLIN